MDRVQLGLEHGVQRQRKWRDRGSQASGLITVTFGRLADGRWWAAWSRDHDGAYVFAERERALRLAYRWMRDSGRRWWPMPAAFGPDQRPVDGLPWVRRGGEWFLERDARG